VRITDHRFIAFYALALCFAPLLPCCASASEEVERASANGAPQHINLTASLRLAGVNNLDIKIVEQRLIEARANHLIALEKFVPSLSGGPGFAQHDGNIQEVHGPIVDVDKQQTRIGGGFLSEVQIGEAIYNSLATHQLVKAAKHATDAQWQDTIYQAAIAFFDLAAAKAAVDVADESLHIASGYSSQVERAANSGISFKGDMYQAVTQEQKFQLILEQARAHQRIAAAWLSQILNLDPAIELVPDQTNLTPISFFDEKETLGSLVGKALAFRPELLKANAQVQAARTTKSGAVYGPAIPTLGMATFWGGLGGGVGNAGANNFNNSTDYFVGISWKIGPGGLFDKGRIDKASAQVKESELENKKYRNEVIRQVVDAHTRMLSLSSQISTAQKALIAANKFLVVTCERKEFGVAEVLEAIDAERTITQIRLDYVNILAEYNKSQFELCRAVGSYFDVNRK